MLGLGWSTTLKEEVKRFINESFYPRWIANTVLVKKVYGKWKTCNYFSNLNDACMMDYFSLWHIDQLVDTTTGNKLLSFINTYSGYNLIAMHVSNQENPSLVNNFGLYYCRIMPFGLKNAGVTYQ